MLSFSANALATAGRIAGRLGALTLMICGGAAHAQDAEAPEPSAPEAPGGAAPHDGPAPRLAPQDLKFVEGRQTWGWTGVAVAGTGLGMFVGGVVVTANSLSTADPDGGDAGASGGIALTTIGATGYAVGLPLATAASLHGARRAKDAGLRVRTTAGWVSVGALGGSLVALAHPVSSAIVSPICAVTSMGAAVGQLVVTRSALYATGHAALAPEPSRLRLALVPTGTGAALAGTF